MLAYLVLLLITLLFLGLIPCSAAFSASGVSKRERLRELGRALRNRGGKSSSEEPGEKKMSWAGQSINVPAILSLGRVVVNPSIAIPHISVPHISYLNFQALHDIGIRAIVFDKDNTLTAPYVDEIHERTAPGLEECRKYFNDSMVILSNSAGTNDDVGFESADRISAALGLPVVRHAEKKPGGLRELMACFPEGLQPHQVCVVGDRLLTDVLFGNLYGMLTVHCQPLTLEGDNKVAKKVRSIESWALLRQFRDRFGFRPQGHQLLDGVKMTDVVKRNSSSEKKIDGGGSNTRSS